MPQRQKNLRLFGFLIVLIITSLVISLIDDNRKSSLEAVDRFQLRDTASIDKISFRSPELDNTLQRTDSGWIVNQKHRADENILRVLFSVMKQVEISRAVARSQREPLLESLQQEGIVVTFYNGEQVAERFTAGGNKTNTQSYFVDPNNDIYIVNLPGYDSYVSGIFEIPEIDWRNRLLLSTTLQSFIGLEMEYFTSAKSGFEILSSGNNIELAGAAKADTAKVFDYAEQFMYFQVDQYYKKGANPVFDSLMNTEPFARLVVRDIRYPDGKRITFHHKTPGSPNMLARYGDNEWVLFDYQRIASIFRDRQWFTSSE